MSSIAALVVLVLLTGNYAAIAITVMQALSYGEIPNVDFIVTAEACDATQLLCSPALRCSIAPSASAGVLNSVTIRSRVGGQIVVEPSAAKQADHKKVVETSPRLVLRKDDVLMWSRSSAMK